MLDGPEVIRILWRRWWLVLVLVVVGAAAGFLYAKGRATQYSAQQSILVTAQTPNPFVVPVTDTSQDPTRVVQTQVDLLASNAVSELAQRRMGGRHAAVSTASTSESDLITLQVTGDSDATALAGIKATLAAYVTVLNQVQSAELGGARTELAHKIGGAQRALAGASNSRVRGLLQQQLSQLRTTQDQLDASLALGTAAAQPVGGPHLTGAVSPSPAQDAVIGAALGFLIAASLAIALRNRSSVRSPSVTSDVPA